ncbi:hypothetical protein BGZ46_006608 [Entomortierella lignicola]|nr:hypothetical protein BGZ46_006608 [Entomortierella lignicola]
MDEIHYSTSLAAPVEEETKDFLEKPKLARFTVKDINTILEWCHSKRDLRTGLSISRILLSRYESSSFNFESEISAPNTRTISLLLMTFASNNHTEGAKRLLACIHDRYSHPIPIDVYVRFLEKLAAKPNQMELMESTLSHLQEHGPAPTVEIYNTFLKSYALHSGSKQAGDFLKNMLGHNHSANRQSFRILIESSLKELRMNRAHYWLAEYSRQGYQITPKMMESFMKTCIQQFVKSRGSKATLKSIVETKAYTNEWMHKALYLIQFMSNQRIQPTATTFELLIEGFLSQGRLLDATKILRRMRDSPHLYTPAAKTWKLFFDYYLTENDHISALKAINDMRHSLSQQPFKSPGAVVPVELYHELFRHVLEHGQLSFAESSLYEMMLNQNRKQPTEKEVVDLIWQLDHNPEAAERVYELLYSQTPDPNISTYKFDEELRHIRRNRILEQGPIQMANVGLMRARANSNKDNLLHEVWKAWNEMTEVFTQNQWQRQLSGDPIDTKAMEKEMSVLASAFEQVAKACRAPKPVKRKRQAEEQEAESATVESGWDFGRVRRAISPTSYGLGLGFGPNGEASSVTSNLSAKGMDRVLIKRLLQRKEVAKPLLDRHDSLIESGTSLSKLTENVEDSSLNYTNDVRLENLKSSFDWVQRYKIPICIEGLNTYISSVLSHNDFDEVKSCLERSILMPSSSSDSSVPTDIPEDAAKSDKPLTKSLSQPLSPDIATIQILYGRMARIPEELMHLSLYRGGQNLIKEWIDRLETIRNWDTSDVD